MISKRHGMLQPLLKPTKKYSIRQAAGEYADRPILREQVLYPRESYQVIVSIA